VGVIDAFPEQLTINNLSDTEAQLTSNVLGCERHDWDDEFDYFFLPCIQLDKYKCVQDWFAGFIGKQFKNQAEKDAFYKSTSLTIDVAGVPHTFGFGGCHGAPDEPIHVVGGLFHVDVNNYYPSFLIAHGRITRAATNDNYQLVYKIRKELKAKQQAAKDKAEKKKYKNMQLPYKKILNALSGAMKDKTSQAYDPRMNNEMCINGQLMLLDLIEHLEVIPGFKLVQSNTDGLIVWIPDTDEAFDMLDDICYEWECRCSTDLCEIGLALDCIQEIIQKDVNNYLWIDAEGGVERIGAYVKELSDLDNDLPIVNEALVNLFTKKIPLADTIYGCDEVKKFQKIVKLSNKYEYVGHEYGNPEQGRGKNLLVYTTVKRYDYKCYRVFASSDMRDGRLLKFKSGKKGEKFANTPEHCFIINEDVNGAKIPDKLDRSWYLRLAEKRAREYGYV
jgi:DNA polymerase